MKRGVWLFLTMVVALVALPAAGQGPAACGCYCGKVLAPPCSDAACKQACGWRDPNPPYVPPPVDPVVQKHNQAQAVYDRGMGLYNSGRYQEAIDAFSEAVNKWPENNAFRQKLADAQAARQRQRNSDANSGLRNAVNQQRQEEQRQSDARNDLKNAVNAQARVEQQQTSANNALRAAVGQQGTREEKIKAEFRRKLKSQAVKDRYSPIDAPLVNDQHGRSTYEYFNVIKQFDVKNSLRYARGADTFCNIYVSDVTRAMHAEIPIMKANDMVGWLHTTGEQRSWHRADARMIQEMADGGHPAIAIWKNTGINAKTGKPRHGHVAMVRPGTMNDPRGDAISAAGAKTIDAKHMTGGDKKDRPEGYFNKPGVEYWYHD